MKNYQQVGNGIRTINGKSAPRVVKSSRQYKKVLEPFILNGLIMDAKTLSKNKVYFDTLFEHTYLVGASMIFQIEAVD